MENKQNKHVINDNKTDFTDISLNIIANDFKRTHIRNRGTLGQLVYSLNDMIERLNNPTNEYQSALYPKIQSECKITVSEYNRLLSTIQTDDYFAIGRYLNGSRNNGKRKPTTTYYEKKSYGVSEYKETLKSMNDRLRHIKYDCLRKVKDTTGTYPNKDTFNRMIVFCDDYHKVVNMRLEEWKTFMDELHTSKGITKKLRVVKKTSISVNNTSETYNSTHNIRVRRKYNSNNTKKNATQ